MNSTKNKLWPDSLKITFSIIRVLIIDAVMNEIIVVLLQVYIANIYILIHWNVFNISFGT